MIKRRDEDVYNFLQDFHHATTSQIEKLFFNNKRYCQMRLDYLSKMGYIKRTKSTISNEHAYFVEKKSYLPQAHHDLIRTELFVAMNEKYKVTTWRNEAPIGNIRPDAIAVIEDHGINFPIFIEIHLNNHFDFDKYNAVLKTVDLKSIFGLMPRIVICTDRVVSVPITAMKFKIVSLDMAGLENLLK